MTNLVFPQDVPLFFKEYGIEPINEDVEKYLVFDPEDIQDGTVKYQLLDDSVVHSDFLNASVFDSMPTWVPPKSEKEPELFDPLGISKNWVYYHDEVVHIVDIKPDTRIVSIHFPSTGCMKMVNKSELISWEPVEDELCVNWYNYDEANPIGQMVLFKFKKARDDKEKQCILPVEASILLRNIMLEESKRSENDRVHHSRSR